MQKKAEFVLPHRVLELITRPMMMKRAVTKAGSIGRMELPPPPAATQRRLLIC